MDHYTLCCDCRDDGESFLGEHCADHMADGLGACIPCPNGGAHFAAPDYDDTFYCRTCAEVSGWGRGPGPRYSWPRYPAPIAG